MPTIAHAILGGAIALLFHTITLKWNTKKKFTERMVILFSFNSMIGPDIFTMLYAFDLDPTLIPIKPFVHSILGWPIWCLGIMWIWYYVVNLRSTEQTRLSKKSTLLLLIAAGEMHFFLDFLDYGVWLIGYGDWTILLTLQDHFFIGMAYPYGPLHEMMPWFSMTEMFAIGLAFMILMIYSLFRWELKYTYLIAIIFLGVILICYVLFGSYVVGYENDFGIILYFGIFFIIPLILMILAMEERGIPV